MSGVRGDALWRAPHGGAGAATIGGALLVDAGLAFCGWGYAGYSLFYGDPFAWIAGLLLGALGASLNFTVDRAMTLSIDKQENWRRTAARLAPRALLAFCLAGTISIPATLRYARPMLSTELMKQQNQVTAGQLQINKTREGVDQRKEEATRIVTDLKAVDAAIDRGPETSEFERAKAAKAEAERAYARVAAVNQRQIANAHRELRALEAAATLAQPPDPRRVAELKARINAAHANIAVSANARNAARQEEHDVWSAWKDTLDAERSRLVKARERSQDQMEDALSRTNLRDRESERQASEQFAPSLSREYNVYLQITADSTHPDSSPLRWASLVFHGVLFLLEMVPILLKLRLPDGPLEAAAEALDKEDIELGRLLSECKTKADTALFYAALRVELEVFKHWEEKMVRRARRGLIGVKEVREQRDRFAA